MVDLAVVVVTWNVREIVLNAVDSLLKDLRQSGLTADVYVVDSASFDGTPDEVSRRFPEVRVIASPENLGFARANNLALRRMGFGQQPIEHLPKAVYLLNPDTITYPGATNALYQALMENPRWGLVGAQLSYEDGNFQHGAFAFPGLRQLWVEFFPTPGRFIEGRFNGRYPRAYYELGKPFPVDFTLGATMMLRRDVIQQTGGFDETFFMYCEEVDWAWRIHKAGWEVYCVPSAHVVHLSGQSTQQIRSQSVINLWTSRLRLFAKHYPAWKYVLARQMIRFGMKRKMRRLEDSVENASLRNAYQVVYDLAGQS